MGGLIWEQRAWSEVTAGVERCTRGLQASQGHSGQQGPEKPRRRATAKDSVLQMTSLLECLAPCNSEGGICWHSLFCSARTLIYSLCALTAQWLFSEPNPSYWSPGAKIWDNIFIAIEYGRGYWIIPATLVFGDFLQEFFFTNLCLKFKRHFVCNIIAL